MTNYKFREKLLVERLEKVENVYEFYREFTKNIRDELSFIRNLPPNNESSQFKKPIVFRWYKFPSNDTDLYILPPCLSGYYLVRHFDSTENVERLDVMRSGDAISTPLAYREFDLRELPVELGGIEE